MVVVVNRRNGQGSVAYRSHDSPAMRPNPAVNRTPAGVAVLGARFVGAGYLTR